MCETDLSNRSIDSYLADEMAPFSMRELSGGDRSPSPINITPNDSLDSPSNLQDLSLDSSAEPKLDFQTDCDASFVSIENVDACISPQQYGQRRESLETIFEDILLDTPPRKQPHTSLIRKVVHRKFVEHSPEGFSNPLPPDSPTGSPLRKRLKNK